MTYREICSFSIKMIGFWLFMGSVLKVGTFVIQTFTQDSAYLTMAIPVIVNFLISLLFIFRTRWIVRIIFKAGLENETSNHPSNAITILWGLSGLLIVIYGIIGFVSIPTTRFVLYQMSNDPYKQLGQYDLGYSSMVLAAIKIAFGLLFMTGWSREGLRNLLGLAKGFDSTLAAAHQRLSDENQEEEEESSESFKE